MARFFCEQPVRYADWPYLLSYDRQRPGRISGDLSFTASPDANGSAVITLLLQDDGGTENGGVDTSASQQLTITIGAVNDASSFPGGADLTVLEDAGAQSVNG